MFASLNIVIPALCRRARIVLICFSSSLSNFFFLASSSGRKKPAKVPSSGALDLKKEASAPFCEAGRISQSVDDAVDV